MNFKRTPFMLLMLALVLLAGAAATYGPRAAGQPRTIHVEVSFVSDFHDARRLAGFVDNVFIGRVVQQTATHSPDGQLPETLFNVEVLNSLKGTLTGTIAVNQQGGFSEAENALIIMENDALLTPGNTYLFATRTGGEGRWHTLVPGFGDIQIKNDTDRDALVKKLQQAIKEQIAYQP